MHTKIITAATILFWSMGVALAQDAAPAAAPAPATAAPAAPADNGAAATPAPAQDAPEIVPALKYTGPGPTEAHNPPMTGPKLLISTSMGDITLQLDAVRAPKTVANILRYVREKHYDGTVFYRVAPGFVIQMGSWDANMKGRSIHPGGVPLEANNGLSNVRGAVAMARGDVPNSATAEFFIDLEDSISLDRNANDTANTTGFAVFGEVAGGMDVVDRIGEVPVGDGGPMPGQTPLTPILVKKVTIIGDGKKK